MLGAIMGDIVGSVYEWNNIKHKDFPLFAPDAFFTDDTVMTLAVAEALLDRKHQGLDDDGFREALIQHMRHLGKLYPNAGYGGHFSLWLKAKDPRPYNSYGNGSAMRVSPVVWAARSLDEATHLARLTAEVTHNHPDGIKGAQATAAAAWLGAHGAGMQDIRDHINANYYPLNLTLDDIRPSYTFDVTCQGSVPPALVAMLESTGVEDAIRNAISIGGDSDTVACITGAVAEQYARGHADYPGILPAHRKEILDRLDDRLRDIFTRFEGAFMTN